MTFDKIITNFNIELTRKCNLKCDFCHRGKAQKIDITKEIIEKTLEELKGIFIQSIQFSGGEFTLVPDLYEYTVNEIIKKNIIISNVGIFTNGVIRNSKILETTKRLLHYVESIQPKIEEISNEMNNIFRSFYSDKKVYVIISDFQHNNEKYIEETIKFYKQISSPNYEVVCQTQRMSENSFIDIEGRAAENYKKILTEPVSIENIRVPVNESFIIEEIEGLNIKTTRGILNISANGNVFIDATTYDMVDTNPLFNIMTCHNDFWNKLESWCWRHPIGLKAKNILEKQKTIDFCKYNNIKTIEDLDDEELLMNACKQLINEICATISNIHKRYPEFNFNECETISAALLYQRLINELKLPHEQTFVYVYSIYSGNIETVKNFANPFWVYSYIQKCINKHEIRHYNSKNISILKPSI